MGKRIVPDNREKIVIKNFYDPDGNIVKIYETDNRKLIGRDRDNYFVDTDLEDMSRIIRHIKNSDERNAAFIDRLCRIDGIHQYRRVDQDF